MITRRTAVLLPLALAACNGDKKPSPLRPPIGSSAISLDPANWNIQYSPGMPPHPTGETGGWYFNFPPTGPNGVDYVTTTTGSVAGRVNITMKFRVVGGPFLPTEGEGPAKVRLFIQRNGDNLSGQGGYEFYRWWSKNVAEVTQGYFTLMAGLDQSEWTSVRGKSGDDPAAVGMFGAACIDLGAIGVTFGGMFAGHGVYGPGSFHLMEYSVN